MTRLALFVSFAGGAMQILSSLFIVWIVIRGQRRQNRTMAAHYVDETTLSQKFRDAIEALYLARLEQFDLRLQRLEVATFGAKWEPPAAPARFRN